MRKVLSKQLLFLLLATAFLNSENASLKAQSTTLPLAEEGDTVLVLINHVKPEMRQQFEEFIHKIFWPMASKLSAADQQLFKQTRVLHPVKPEPDGTYHYLFIMDPFVSGADYSIRNLLKKMYPEKEAEEYAKMFYDTRVKEQTRYMAVQSKRTQVF